jgi:hypothetical protein
MNVDRRSISVLVVEAGSDLRGDLAAWLSQAGLLVTTCAGPHLAQPACPFDRTGPCDLVRRADVVVLDEWLESDTTLTGTPGWELAVAYHALGKPLIILAEGADPVRFEEDPSVVVLRRSPDAGALIRAIESVVSAPRGGGEAWLIDACPPVPQGGVVG